MAITKLTPPDSNRPIVDQNLSMTQETRTWFQTITDRSLIIGDGSPDGVIEAPEGAEYMDRLGTPGNIKSIKRDSDVGGDKTLGWVLI